MNVHFFSFVLRMQKKRNEPKKRKQAQKERACRVFKRKFSGTRPDKFYLISCRFPSQPCLEFPSRSLLSQTTLRCRLFRLRIILLSTLLTFVTKSFGFLSLTTELETLRARSPFGLDSALQKIRLAPRVSPVRKFAPQVGEGVAPSLFSSLPSSGRVGWGLA